MWDMFLYTIGLRDGSTRQSLSRSAVVIFAQSDPKATLKKKVVSCPLPDWAKFRLTETFFFTFVGKSCFFSPHIFVYPSQYKNENGKNKIKILPYQLASFLGTRWTGNDFSLKGGLMDTSCWVTYRWHSYIYRQTDTYTCTFQPILHYTLGLRFGKVCEQKLEKNATGSRFYPTHRII